MHIGQSQGRGRQDRAHTHAKSIKDIYLYALERPWWSAPKACQLPDTRPVCVMDREADFFELFDEQRNTAGNNAGTSSGRVDLLVRAKHDRATTTGEPHLFDSVKASPAQARVHSAVPRQSARPKKSR